ncbi:MAG: D-lyxose/D-mannose family sugar isomerase [Fimbriimonadaceae bacterium]|nr:D-lyxose/D-mannose family sugar isomerase [Fimbriimonadaceae bacterium]
MKRSEINQLILDATACFQARGWSLPPNPRWDVTDFGLGNWERWGLVLVNLSEQPEYCEKLMYAKRGMVTPAHCHRLKKEDIICRWGGLRVTLWAQKPSIGDHEAVNVQINGESRMFFSWDSVMLGPGERITLEPGVWHEFEPTTDDCIMGEVSTANDDVSDNCFANSEIGRFSEVREDEEPIVRLVNDR